jgi:hypothetical protein
MSYRSPISPDVLVAGCAATEAAKLCFWNIAAAEGKTALLWTLPDPRASVAERVERLGSLVDDVGYMAVFQCAHPGCDSDRYVEAAQQLGIDSDVWQTTYVELGGRGNPNWVDQASFKPASSPISTIETA